MGIIDSKVHKYHLTKPIDSTMNHPNPKNFLPTTSPRRTRPPVPIRTVSRPTVESRYSSDKDSFVEQHNVFSRHHPVRSSLPFIIKPAMNSSKATSLGLCFLICENETKKVLLPSNISCLDTLKALFVRAFPQHLTMKQMDMDHMRIYIREMEKEIFYQLEDVREVKDRSVLKLVQLNCSKPHVSFKQPETEEIQPTVELSPERLTTNNDVDDASSCSQSDTGHPQCSSSTKFSLGGLKGILSTPKNDEDARTKMALMEKQLESLTELVKELTQTQHQPTRLGQLIDSNNKSLYQQLKELKIKTFHLRDDLTSIRRMQQSLQEDFQRELEEANRKIEEQLFKLNRQDRTRSIETQFDLYVKNSLNINRDLEDLEIAVEQMQNDIKTKQCHVTINDVESFALVLSNISRSLVDLKASFPDLREKLSKLNQPAMVKFLNEEPERLDFTIKKCKRLTTMLYQLKRSAVDQEQKTTKKIVIDTNGFSNDRSRLLEQIRCVTFNSDRRIKAIEKAEKLRERRFFYEHQLEVLKQMKNSSETNNDASSDNNNCSSTRTSVCSSPSLSMIVRHALTSTTSASFHDGTNLFSSSSLPKKIFSSNKKIRPTPPPRIQSTSSSSAVSSASSSFSSCTGGNSRLTNGFCGILPLLSSVDRRNPNRCYSLSSSSTDTDSALSNTGKTLRTSTRVSVTDL